MFRFTPFRDFWLDCNAAMLFSILLSTNSIDKAYLYNNRYEYKLLEEDVPDTNETFVSLRPMMDTSLLMNEMFADEREEKLYCHSSPIDEIKKILDQGRILMLDVDLFFWVEDTVQYGNIHLNHYSLVEGYDDGKKSLVVLETGNRGYYKYLVPYDKATEAIRATGEESLTYILNDDLKGLLFSKNDIIRNAETIIRSLDYVFANQEYFLSVSTLSSLGICDVYNTVQTHLFEIQNREKVNRKLFSNAFEMDVVDGYCFSREFRSLEKKFEIQKNLCIKNQLMRSNGRILEEIGKKTMALLKEEQEVWKQFIQVQDSLRLKVENN